MDVGDAEVLHMNGETALLVERKTLADLEQSLRDGRYAEQKVRLSAAAGRSVMYVLEGGPADLHSDDIALRQQPRLLGAVMSLQLQQHTRLVRTADVNDTAWFLLHAAAALRRWRRSASDTDDDQTLKLRHEAACCLQSAVRSRKSSNMDPALCYLQQLCQVPGVSLCIARSLRDAYGSMAALHGALGPMPRPHRLSVLRSLQHVGAKTAETLDRYLFV